VCISCGEASGDLYAAALARELRAVEPGIEVFGFGGRALRDAGAELVGDYRGLTVTGLVEAVGVLPRSYAMYRRLVAAARRARPDVFVAVDFPDFNFRVAAAMRRLGVPTVYYVGPQLWAWRPGRMRTMRRLASLVLVIFPFEEPLYRAAGVPVAFVGHPLVDLARPGADRAAFLHGLGLAADAPTIALLPGSRPNEVRAILPGLLAAGRLIEAAVPGAQFVLARAPGLADALFAPAGGPEGPPVTVVEGRTDEVLASSDVALVASGTATVQAALHERPMVIVYRVSPVTYRLGRPFVRVSTFGMVNLIAGRRVVPELVQDAFTPTAVADEAVSLLTDAARAAAVRAALREVRDRLGASGASRRAAHAVIAVARGEPAERAAALSSSVA
jgi:lipid-A-disaccharide synthase